MVVVANALNREILDDQLSAGNIPVKHARTGSAALGAQRTAALHNEPFELVIIDDSLPDMTGAELAQAIKAASDGIEQQIILLTSFDRDVGQVAEGALRRLTKPIRQSSLWECIAVRAQAVPAITSAPKTPAPDQPGKGRAPVLVVEDSPVNLEVAVAILESMGCVVETAVNGRRALDRHASGEYGLIFMDCQMPEMDGFEATAEIRRREALSGGHTPIVALTASVVEDGRRRCLAVGMDDYLAKPFTLEQMRSVCAAKCRSHAVAGAARTSGYTRALVTRHGGGSSRPDRRSRIGFARATAKGGAAGHRAAAHRTILQGRGRSSDGFG